MKNIGVFEKYQVNDLERLTTRGGFFTWDFLTVFLTVVNFQLFHTLYCE